jgi:hypothetical protein
MLVPQGTNDDGFRRRAVDYAAIFAIDGFDLNSIVEPVICAFDNDGELPLFGIHGEQGLEELFAVHE